MGACAASGMTEECSNVGRWGPDDQRGTLNHITAADVIAAASLVRSGRVISLAHEIRPSAEPGSPVRLTLTDGLEPNAGSASDEVAIAPHGFAVTHVDALGHIVHDGRMWNGRTPSDEISAAGLRFASVRALSGGIVTKGVLLDIPRASGVERMPVGHTVSTMDLDRAESFAGVQVSRGDAMIVRLGLDDDGLEGASRDRAPEPRAGLGVDCVAWIHARSVAAYGGDCVERLPSEIQGLAMPLHQIGVVAMGLVMLDNLAVEELAVACVELGRWEFLLVCGPLPILGATGSAVNPLAVL